MTMPHRRRRGAGAVALRIEDVDRARAAPPSGQPAPPRLISFLLINLASGVAVAIALVAALLWLDVQGLGTLMAAAEQPFTALFLLFFSFSTTFGLGAMSTAMIMLGEEEDG